MTKKSAKDAEATFLDKRNVFMDLITPSSCIYIHKLVKRKIQLLEISCTYIKLIWKKNKAEEGHKHKTNNASKSTLKNYKHECYCSKLT